MATFKRVADIHAIQISGKLATGTATYKVGDLISYVASTGIVAKITKASEVEAALAAGKKVLLISQGDAVTEKTGTAYKTYKISQDVAMTNVAKTIVGYDVTDVTNVDGYAAE